MAFLWRKVIHDDHIARAQCRAQDLADIKFGTLRVGGAVNGHAGRRTTPRDGTERSGGLPVAAGVCWREPVLHKGHVRATDSGWSWLRFI
jgi:hypothetical protein